MMATSRHPIEQGRTTPPVEPRHQSGGDLLCADNCLGLLILMVLIFIC
jgi:hypothetical protein